MKVIAIIATVIALGSAAPMNRGLEDCLATFTDSVVALVEAAEDITGFELDMDATEAELRALKKKLEGMSTDKERMDFLTKLKNKAEKIVKEELAKLSAADRKTMEDKIQDVIDAAVALYNEYNSDRSLNRSLDDAMTKFEDALEQLIDAAEVIVGFELDMDATEAELKAIKKKLEGMATDKERMDFLTKLKNKAEKIVKEELAKLSAADRKTMEDKIQDAIDAAVALYKEYTSSDDNDDDDAEDRDLNSSLNALQTAAVNLVNAVEDISGYDLDVGATVDELKSLYNKISNMGSNKEKIDFVKKLANEAADEAEKALNSLSQADQKKLKDLFGKVVSAAKDVINDLM